MTDQFPPPGYIPTSSRLAGIEIFIPAPPDNVSQPEVVDFKCPQCGAATAFSAADGGLTCSHCGYYEAPEKAVVGKRAAQFEFTVETMERATQGWGAERKELACQDCGATTTIPADSLTHTCTFCGSNQVIQRQAAQDVMRPRFLIPFKIEAEACQKITGEWLSSSWMTPAALQKLAALAKFNGVFLPFWTFAATTCADWKAQVGHTRTERYYDHGEWKTRTVTDWVWESGQATLKIVDLLQPGTARLSARLLKEVKSYNLSELAPYEPKYLAGLQAQAYDIPLEKAWDTGRQEMRERTRQACLSQASTSQVRSFSMNLDFVDESWRYVLLPVYLATYTYESKPYQVMVNGETGKITGQRPADWNKIWLVIALLLAPGLLLSLLGLLTIPFAGAGLAIGGFGFVLLVIGLVIGLTLYSKANALDDL
jgi:DNA-directed RNA polymerase subunit RPC12/RpoP